MSGTAYEAVNETRLRVRYAETDQMGVVYHSNHLIWFEVGRVELMRGMGFSYRDMEREDGCFIAVAEATCRYRAPVFYDEEIIVRTRLKTVRESVIIFSYELARADTGALLAPGRDNPHRHRFEDEGSGAAGEISKGIPRCGEKVELLRILLNALHISGNDLTLEAVREVAVERRAVLLAPDSRAMVEQARAVVEAIVSSNQVAYAITTGVGKLSDVRIAGDQIRELQVNLVRSHAVGVGEPLPSAETRSMMLLRANSLAKGHSGVRPIVIDTLVRNAQPRGHPTRAIARERRRERRSRTFGAPGAGSDG